MTGWSGGRKGHDWKIDEVALAQEDFTTQMDRMVHSEDTSQALYQPCLSFPNGFMNRVAIVAGMEVTDEFQFSIFLRIPCVVCFQLGWTTREILLRL